MKKILKNPYIIYTLIFLCLSAFVFIDFLLEHKSFIWISDGLQQHFLFLYRYSLSLRETFSSLSLFSFSLGLGQDVIGQLSYYVIGDPTSYLSLLFPISKIEFIYNISIYLKFYLVGISFLYYATYKKFPKEKAVLGAILYTFNGFTLYAGVRHLSFLLPVIFFPFLLVGVEKLILEGKKKDLILTAALACISNYYFFVTISILAFIYAVILLITKVSKEKWVPIIKDAIVSYVVAIFIAGFVLFPTAYTFLNSARTGGFRVLFYPPSYYKNLFTGIVTNSAYGIRYWSLFSTSSIILVFLPIFIKNRKKNKELFWYFLLLGFIYLVPLFGQMINGMSYPANRWSFGFTFVLSLIIVNSLDLNYKYSKEEKKFMILFLALYSICAILITNYKKEMLCMLVFAYLFLILVLFPNKNKRTNTFFILSLVCVNILFLSTFLYNKNTKYQYINDFVEKNTSLERLKTNNHTMEGLEEAIKKVKEDKSFYRINVYPNSIENLGLVYNYNGLSSYLSLAGENESSLGMDLNNSSYAINRYIKDFDNRVKITTKLATKYYIVNEPNKEKVPFGYEEYYHYKDTYVYKNKYFLPLATFSNHYITKEEYDKLSSLDKEQILLSTVVLEEKDSRLASSKEEIKRLNQNKTNLSYKLDETSSIKIENNKIKVANKNDKLVLQVDDKADSEIYLEIKNVRKVHKKGKVNALLERVSSSKTNNIYPFKITVSKGINANQEERRDYFNNMYYFENRDFLMNLGYEKKEKDSSKIIIQFNHTGTYLFDEINLYAVNMKNYQDTVSKIEKANGIKLNQKEIELETNRDKDGILSMSIPYSKGWKVLVDGKKEKALKINNSMIGLYVEKGKHEIKFYYETPYLKLGILSSIIGVMLFVYIAKKEGSENG